MRDTHGGESKEADAAWRQGPELEDWGHCAIGAEAQGEGVSEGQAAASQRASGSSIVLI